MGAAAGISLSGFGESGAPFGGFDGRRVPVCIKAALLFPLVSVVNVPESTIARESHGVLRTLAGPEIGAVLEGLMGLAAKQGRLRARPGPRDPALRRARVCYDHLAGEMGVRLFDSLRAAGRLAGNEENVTLTPDGRAFATEFGLDLAALEAKRRPLCRACLDWSMRRTHLAGGLGAALLNRIYDLGWAKRIEGARIVAFTKRGEEYFNAAFPL